MNSAVDAANDQYHARRDELGIPAVTDSDQLPPEYSCKWLQLLQYRRPLLQQAVTMRSAAQSACSGYYDQTRLNAADVDDLLVAIDARIPVFTQRCQAFTAQQPNAVAAQQPVGVASGVANQPASCSTITGTGMGNSGPTNCNPQGGPTFSQPTAATQAPAPAPTPTPRGPANPVDPATQTAQQLFSALNVPVPQPSATTPDPEAQARTAFDQGKAAFDAHNCPAALQYFNQAVSLSAAYGANYAAWRDRAQACAQPPAQPQPQPDPGYRCVAVANGVATATPIACTTEASQWTSDQPKNHGPGAVILQMADGAPLTIMPGQGLWRAPGGVGVMNWDGTPSSAGFGTRGPEGCPYVGNGWAMLGNEACRQQKVYRASQ